MRTTLVLLCVAWLALTSAGKRDQLRRPAPWFEPENAEQYFEEFVQKFNRNYADENEKQARFQIFKENLNKINNMQDTSYATFGITQFTDMTREEFESKMLGLKSFQEMDPTEVCTFIYDEDILYNDAPESFDWRDQNVVTPIKDQGACGSCYAFSATGNIEGQYAIKHKELVSVSEQQIVDCDEEDFGCGGGLMSVAIRSLINQGGCESEADYPYEGYSDTCRFDANKVKVQISDCRSFNLTSQEKLKQLLYHTGPIAIGIQASGLQMYTTGIITDDDCDVGEINHGVLLVGYGTEGDVPYWIVKNSWDTSFGEDGYFRMHRGENNRSCSVLNDFMASAVLE